MKAILGGTELYSPALLDGKLEKRRGQIITPLYGYREIEYCVVDGMAIFEGDIVLGTVPEIEARNAFFKSKLLDGGIVKAVRALGSTHKLWPDNTVYYDIESSLSDQSRVTDAIAHWVKECPLKFVRRTTEQNYIFFREADGCYSYVGMQGGRQDIGVADWGTKGNMIHEIGHAAGLWHEQSRADRDRFVTINWNNIINENSFNFNQHINDGEDIGLYDYGSIMHYGQYAFSSNGEPTIVPLQDKKIGQRNALSQADIMGVEFMYLYDNEEIITDIQLIAGKKSDIQPPDGYVKINQDLNEGAGGKFIYVCYKKEKSPDEYITDIIAIAGNSSNIQPPAGYVKINQDTNEGAGGKFIYICYKKSSEGVPITNLTVIAGDSSDTYPTPGLGFARVNQDLNQGAGGKYIYICFQPDPFAPITDITLIAGDSSAIDPPNGYVKTNIDLNKGAGGKYIYICYKKDPGVPVTDIILISGKSKDIQPPEGYTKINQDTNQGAGGKFIYVCFRKETGDPVDSITVIYGSSSDIQPPPGFIRINQDTNQGAGGKFIYICYRNSESAFEAERELAERDEEPAVT